MLTEVERAEGYVEYESAPDASVSYKERRKNHGFVFSFGYDSYFPRNFISLLDNDLYENVYGKNDINFYQLQMGYKYNFMLGSFGVSAIYADGRANAINSIEDRKIIFEKYGIGASYWMDNLFSEPLVVPYGSIQGWVMDVTEKSKVDSFSGRTKTGLAFTVGALIQLNRLDEESARTAYMMWGLENAYLDIYAVQYENTESSSDPYLESDLNYGVGLKLEF
ncbi:MAG: hypothetical protein ACOYOK_02765 [Pseudobdellovibrionaceae bacterium]